MKQYYIYKIVCLMDEWNGKFYIGKHYGKLDDAYTGSGKLIREYFKEFGKERNITYEKIILEIGDENNICDLEREYIREGLKSELCLNLYRISSTGSFGNNKPKSEEHKRKMRKPKSDEHRKHISEALKGRQLSTKHKRKLSEVNKGLKRSEETRKKISESKKGQNNPMSRINREKRNNLNI